MTLPAALPRDEAARLERLHALAVLDTAPEALFDALTATASALCGTPVALVSLVDEHRQWFKSAHGMPGVTETPRDVAFCAHALLQHDVFQVDDALDDVRFAGNPLVTGPAAVRFYAGAPIALSDGSTVGTLCVIDHVPNRLTPEQRRLLMHLAGVAAHALEFRQTAMSSVAQTIRAESEIAKLYKSTPAMLHSIDGDGRLQTVSDHWLSELGYARDEVLGRHVADFLDPASRRHALDEVLPRFFETGYCRDVEYRMVRKDGSVIDILLSSVLSRDADDRPDRSMTVSVNVTERRRAEHALRDQQARMARILEGTHAGTWELNVDTGECRYNARWAEIIGFTLAELGRTDGDAWRQLLHPDDVPKAMDLLIDHYDGKRDYYECECRVRHKDGSWVWIVDRGRVSERDPTGRPLWMHGTRADITERKRAEQEMRHRATHDPLTGLLNRGEFETRLASLLGRMDAEHVGALLYVDLDQFKLVNDACGHAAGDLLLRQVSALLRVCVRGHDSIARLGGDEFGVLVEACTLVDAERVAQDICDRMDEFRFVHDGRRFRVGASIGLVPVDDRWTSNTTLLQAADAACYAAKDAGRNRVHVWFDSDEIVQARRGDMQWASRLEVALDEDRFELFGQRIEPIDGSAAGLHFEVLLRLREPGGALVPPGAFLPAAERFHLATRIDRWVVRNAVAQLRAAEARGVHVRMMSVNLSGQSLGDSAFHRDAIQLIRTGTDLSKLCFEITETAAITHLDVARSFIDELRAMGVRIALDDFGAGASSFGYLKSLPVDFLKIDGHFVKHLLEDELAHAAVRCFCEVAKVVGVRTIAEFVERPEVRERLAALGVDLAQGYLLHRPEPLRDLLAVSPLAMAA